ncbi:MAG: asparaginase [Gammaproteobacteria bacterium]|nr:asparaginase [Gammaproteobacteria bacterium]MDH3467276.1 asparaginase [Gammaproteobacteria bacterium]
MSEFINPVLVEVSRGTLVESVHRGAAAIVDHGGGLVAAWGDVERSVFARSALKPLQALPLIESGAADAFAVSDDEIALACASHGGEPMHVDRVRGWLKRLGLGESDLECGAHMPTHGPTANAMIRSDHEASAVHNNCSGKHAGMLATALYLRQPTAGYIRRQHAVQRGVRETLSALCETDLSDAPDGTDGCGIPVIGMSLHATAQGMAHLANPAGLPRQRAAAAARVVRAMRRYPELVAGTDRFCTVMMRHTEAAVKTGAEGVYTAVLPNQGWGIALKIDDGAARAAEVAMAALLEFAGIVTKPYDTALAERMEPPVTNVANRIVGAVRAVPELRHR